MSVAPHPGPQPARPPPRGVTHPPAARHVSIAWPVPGLCRAGRLTPPTARRPRTRPCLRVHQAAAASLTRPRPARPHPARGPPGPAAQGGSRRPRAPRLRRQAPPRRGGSRRPRPRRLRRQALCRAGVAHPAHGPSTTKRPCRPGPRLYRQASAVAPRSTHSRYVSTAWAPATSPPPAAPHPPAAHPTAARARLCRHGLPLSVATRSVHGTTLRLPAIQGVGLLLTLAAGARDTCTPAQRERSARPAAGGRPEPNRSAGVNRPL